MGIAGGLASPVFVSIPKTFDDERGGEDPARIVLQATAALGYAVLNETLRPTWPIGIAPAIAGLAGRS